MIVFRSGPLTGLVCAAKNKKNLPSLLPILCRCRRSLFELITLGDTHKHSHTHTHTHTHSVGFS